MRLKRNLNSIAIAILLSIPIVIGKIKASEEPVLYNGPKENDYYMIEAIATAEIVKLPVVNATTAEVTSIETEPVYSEEDLYLLAHLIGGEAGANYCEDEMLYLVGSVVLNRVARSDFPDTIKEVIYQEGQYACTWDGNFDREPSERCWRIAKELLTNGSVAPVDVVFQAEFVQGIGIYKKVQNMYFCYGKGE